MSRTKEPSVVLIVTDTKVIGENLELVSLCKDKRYKRPLSFVFTFSRKE